MTYLRSELEYQEEVLRTAHFDFERYYREWCANNDLDLVELNKQNSKQVQSIFKQEETKLAPLETPPEKQDEKRVSKLLNKTL